MAVRALSETEDRPPLRFIAPDDVAKDAEKPREADPVEPPSAPKAKPVKPVREQRIVQFPTAEMMAVLGFLVKALGVRVLLFLAAVGVFILSLIASSDPSIPRISLCAIFAVLVFLPLLWLSREKN